MHAVRREKKKGISGMWFPKCSSSKNNSRITTCKQLKQQGLSLAGHGAGGSTRKHPNPNKGRNAREGKGFWQSHSAQAAAENGQILNEKTTNNIL